MTLAMSADTIAYYQREADRRARGMQVYGGDPRIVSLRCFKYYHPDQGSFLTDPGGRDRWLGPKASRVYAVLHRIAGTGERMTMTQIASEVLCAPSTVSRVVTKLQAWELFAIDVVRGRNGGVTVRKRQIGDALKSYAAAAWARIRSWINVASRSAGDQTGTENPLTAKDATFSWERRVEYAGERVRDGSWSIDYARAVAGGARERRSDADLADERATAWALEVIAERRRLDVEDPDWDLELEKARERWLH